MEENDAHVSDPVCLPTHVRILVVDDNHDAAESLAMLLSMRGHEVLTAHDGHSALESALAHRPHLMLLDIGLPGMNGYEVARRLRGSAKTKSVVLAAVTGWGQEDDVRRALDAGFDCHLTKPASMAAIERLLESLNLPHSNGETTA